MSLDRHDRAINCLYRANEQASEAVKAEAPGIHPSRSWSHQPGEYPAQEDPGVDQNQAHCKQEEAQGRIARSGMSSHLTHRAIAALDAETPAIACMDLLGFPVELDDDESQPLAASLAGLIGHQAGEQGQAGGGAILEGVVRAIALAAPAEGAGTTLFAANRAGNDGRLTNIGQIADDRPGSKGFVPGEP